MYCICIEKPALYLASLVFLVDTNCQCTVSKFVEFSFSFCKKKHYIIILWCFHEIFLIFFMLHTALEISTNIEYVLNEIFFKFLVNTALHENTNFPSEIDKCNQFGGFYMFWIKYSVEILVWILISALLITKPQWRNRLARGSYNQVLLS